MKCLNIRIQYVGLLHYFTTVVSLNHKKELYTAQRSCCSSWWTEESLLYSRDGFNHVHTHLHAAVRMVGTGLGQPRHAVVAVAQNLNAQTVILLETKRQNYIFGQLQMKWENLYPFLHIIFLPVRITNLGIGFPFIFVANSTGRLKEYGKIICDIYISYAALQLHTLYVTSYCIGH